MADLRLLLGVKTDPTQYRYSYPWLFRLLAAEGVRYVQLGTFFEMYQLSDAYFLLLRRQAEDAGVAIHSVFTAHRELGGFFVQEPGWELVARRNYERLIEIGALLGAHSVGSNPGAVLRDQMGHKSLAVECYLRHMKELLHYAHRKGVEWLTIEPMSCLAEPPTLPDEIRHMAEELDRYRQHHAQSTARLGFCVDIAHGYADHARTVRHTHLELLESAIPYLYELHLKNTDEAYCSTFGFSAEERRKGIIQIEPVRRLLFEQAHRLPVGELVGYLEIGGPKLGRDYSDKELAEQLRASLEHLKQTWVAGEVPNAVAEASGRNQPLGVGQPGRPVCVSASLMCADLCNLESSVRQLEAAGADMLHLDLADGHFVPNMLLGLDLVRQLRPKTSLPLDVHLMVENPELYVDPLAEIGVEMIAVHVEATCHLDRLLALVREKGMRAGVALNPATPLSAIEYVLERLDFVLLMTVNPGFAGQKLSSGAMRKIGDCRRFLADRGLRLPVMVDGNVSFEHIPSMVAAGAEILVAGTSSWFSSSGSLAENVKKTEAAIAKGLSMRRQTCAATHAKPPAAGQ